MSNATNARDKAEDRRTDDKRDIKDRVQDAAARGMEKAKEAGQEVAEQASNLSEKAVEKADDAVGYVGSGVKSLGDKMKDNGPQEGVLGKGNATVADTIRKSGEYLESHGLSGIGEDVTDMIRRNPVPAVLIGVAVGYLLARATRSDS